MFALFPMRWVKGEPRYSRVLFLTPDHPAYQMTCPYCGLTLGQPDEPVQLIALRPDGTSGRAEGTLLHKRCVDRMDAGQLGEFVEFVVERHLAPEAAD